MPRLYKFLEARWALDDLCRRRVKISQLADMNDPMELMSIRVRRPLRRRDLDRAISEMNGRFGALCFCRRRDHLLLWAHYADKHRGICLGFDVSPEIATSVRYISKPATLSKRSDLVARVAQEWIFSKFKPWRYEDEVRVYATLAERDGDFYFADFSPQLRLREVILGARCTTPVRDIVAATASYPRPPVLRRARISTNPPRITVRPLAADR